MSEPFPRAVPGGAPERALAAAGACALALLLFVLAYSPVEDADVWWHLKAGWSILENSAVPRTNLFDYTTDHPWIDLHWLYQVLAFEVWSLFGAAGLVTLKVFAIGATWALLTRVAVPRGAFAAMLPFLAAGMVAASERMTDRPELFSHLFLLVQVALLLRWRRRPSPGPLVAIVALQAIWANFHALSVLGVAVVGAFVAGEGAQILLRRRGWGRDAPPAIAPRDLAQLALAGAGCALALLATPYGIEGARFPLTLFAQLQSKQVAIAEFMSPFSAFRPTAPVLAFRAFAGAVGVVLLLSLRRADPSLLFLLLGTFALAASARRNIPLFVFGGLLYTGAHLRIAAAALPRPLVRALSARASAWMVGLLTVGAIVWVARDVASGRFYARDALIRRFGGGIQEAMIPRGAMDYVLANDLRGNPFNDIDSGGYFIWRAYPARRAFIDARLEARPHSQLDVYSAAFYAPGGWRALDARHRFDYLVINHTVPVNVRLLERIQADPGWALVHVDPVGLVYVRRATAPASLLERDEIAPGRRAPPPFTGLARSSDPIGGAVRAILRVEPSPEPRPLLAYGAILYRLGFPRQAAAPVDAALEVDPGSAYAHLLRGSIAAAAGDPPRAIRAFEDALRLEPTSMEAAFNLGTTRLQAGDLAGAASALERAAAIRPAEARPLFLLGVARLGQGDPGRAKAALERAIQVEPALTDAYYYLALAAGSLGDSGRASSLLADFLRRPGGNPELRADAARRLGMNP